MYDFTGEGPIVEPSSRRLLGVVGISFEHRRIVGLEQPRVAHEHEIALGGFDRVHKISPGFILFGYPDKQIGAAGAVDIDSNPGVFRLEGCDERFVRAARQGGVPHKFFFGLGAGVKDLLAVGAHIAHQLVQACRLARLHPGGRRGNKKGEKDQC